MILNKEKLKNDLNKPFVNRRARQTMKEANNISLTLYQKAVLTGTLLGDGSLGLTLGTSPEGARTIRKSKKFKICNETFN
jgi:hypothetical protein